jgi:hypothetical protein
VFTFLLLLLLLLLLTQREDTLKRIDVLGHLRPRDMRAGLGASQAKLLREFELQQRDEAEQWQRQLKAAGTIVELF